MQRSRSIRKSGGTLLSSSSHHSSSKDGSNNSSNNNNPIKTDAELNILVHSKLEPIQKYKTFQRWKDKFMVRFQTFLFEKGMDPAQQQADALQATLRKLIQQTSKVGQYIEKGDLSAQKKTVKASLAINEMCHQLEQSRQELQSLIPSLKIEEKRLGYTKFHLGAILIQQDFPQYVSMKQIEAQLNDISDALQEEDVLDKQQHELFGYYNKHVQRFCDIMADLDMYEIMMKCIQFRDPPDESESDDPIEFEIQVYNVDTDDTITMEVLETDTIAIVQDMIATGFETLPTTKQVLTYHETTVNDHPDKTLTEVGVKQGDTLHVQRYKMPVQIKKWDDSCTPVTYQVDPEQFVSSLQRTCAPDMGIDAENQRLYHNDELLHVTKRLQDHPNLKANDVLIVEPKIIKVHAQLPDGSMAELSLSVADDTLESIRQQIEHVSFMPAAKQVVRYQEKLLPAYPEDDPDSTPFVVREMGLRDGDTLQVDVYTVPFSVKCWDGQILNKAMDPAETLSQLKRDLANDTGIVPEKQNLFLHGPDGVVLNGNTKSLKDNGIEECITLYLEPSTITVNATMPDGAVQLIDISPRDDLGNIKDAIAKTTGVKIERQQVKHDGELLPEGQTAKDMGLKEGTSLSVEIFKIPIKVKTWDDKTIDVMVEPCDTLSNIKKMLEPECGIQADNQTLSKDGIPLEGDVKTTEDLGIVPDDVLDLEPKIFSLDLNMPDGSKAQILISPNHDANAIKREIHDSTGIDPGRLQLFQNDNELPDGVPAKALGLKGGKYLDVSLKMIPICVFCYDGRTFNLNLEPNETIGNVKKFLEPLSKIEITRQVLVKDDFKLEDDSKTLEGLDVQPNDSFFLEPSVIICQVSKPGGKTDAVELRLSDDGNEIRNKIADATDISASRQVLQYKGSKIPSQGKTVKDLGLRDGSVLDVSIHKIPVRVQTWHGPDVDLLVEPITKLASLKEMLSVETGIEPSNQNLSFENANLSGDSLPISDHGIDKGSILNLEPFVIACDAEMPDGSKHAVRVPLIANSNQVKDIVADASGLEANRQIVKHKKKELPKRPDTTVRDMNIRDGDTLNVSIDSFPVTVNTWDGKTIRIIVEPSQSLLDIKKGLENDTMVPADNQRLFLCDNELLGDSKSASAHNIKRDATLDLEPKSIRVNCQMPDGTSHVVPLNLSDTTDEIKQKIATATGMAAPRQIVRHRGVILSENHKSVKDMSIADGATLTVEILKEPIHVNLPDGRQIKLMFDLTEPLGQLKGQLAKESGVVPKKQLISMFGGDEFIGDDHSVSKFGVRGGAVLDLEIKDDPIIFIDVKYGTLFGLDREEAITTGVVTPNQGNPYEFVETITKNLKAEKERMAKDMLESTNLGVKPQIVVDKTDIDEYDMQEKEAVKNVWGVSLKKTEKKAKSTEFFFVDVKTENVGRLDRTKLMDLKFINVVGFGKTETLEQAEKDQQRYDFFVREIRRIFRISSTK